VGGQLQPPIPGERSEELFRKVTDLAGQRSDDADRVLAVDLDQQNEARVALDEGRDVGVVGACDQVAFQ